MGRNAVQRLPSQQWAALGREARISGVVLVDELRWSSLEDRQFYHKLQAIWSLAVVTAQRGFLGGSPEAAGGGPRG